LDLPLLTALAYLERREIPEVFVTIADSVAYGMIKGLSERGIRVPDDVSIIGFDDIELPTIRTVPLTASVMKP
jgi:LacI family transcriptional regulator